MFNEIIGAHAASCNRIVLVSLKSKDLLLLQCHVSSVMCQRVRGQVSCVECHVTSVKCQVSSVMCHVSCVKCHLSSVMCQVS